MLTMQIRVEAAKEREARRMSELQESEVGPDEVACAQCEANARYNEAGGYHELAKKCREYCRRGHRETKEMGTEPKMIKVDSTHGKAPHKRHRAVVNEVRRPYWNGAGVRILYSEVALTLCGRSLSNFTNAENLNLNFADNGGVYAVECEHCFHN